ncbi:hypothetical protein B0H65DRAFT_545678 [Neurospora tetraspora]|uniref:Uncharacterized protein n=1 Tax=Neurospora tetraspora TaxID=94610 RepID=A0AAE0JJI8_9PEZI|nr:hypothetical protein B0H65DRAFT_545678 [Neurospora tetraspora]
MPINPNGEGRRRSETVGDSSHDDFLGGLTGACRRVLVNGAGIACSAVRSSPSLLVIVECQQNLTMSVHRMVYGENSGPVAGVSPIPTTTGRTRTGSLRGGTNLLGANSPQPDLDTANPAIVPNPQSVNGQDANADLGLYLDFNSANPPQPNRGGRGGTDPGPNK